MFECTICGKKFDEIPKDAEQLTNPGRGQGSAIYRFTDGSIHALRIVRKKKALAPTVAGFLGDKYE
jgi:hypothetical protein